LRGRGNDFPGLGHEALVNARKNQTDAYRIPQLHRIWRRIAATGCRASTPILVPRTDVALSPVPWPHSASPHLGNVGLDRPSAPACQKSWPELCIRKAAAHTRIVSGRESCPSQRELSRHLKYIDCARIPEFESYDPSHAVVSSAVMTGVFHGYGFARSAQAHCIDESHVHSVLGYNTPAEIEANPTLPLSVMKRSTAGSSATCPDFTVSP
jgi:hypothetical protein